MKSILLAMAFLTVATIAHAQVIVQVPGIAIVPAQPDYWRGEGEQRNQWHKREEFKQEAQRHADWEHSHCVRDWQNQTLCR
jgi:hypothetical protein